MSISFMRLAAKLYLASYKCIELNFLLPEFKFIFTKSHERWADGLNHTHSVSLLARNLVTIISAIVYHETSTYTCTPIFLQVLRIQINSLKNNFPTGYFKIEPPSGNIFEPHQYYILRKQYIINMYSI
jgi:hypothetical protein